VGTQRRGKGRVGRGQRRVQRQGRRGKGGGKWGEGEGGGARGGGRGPGGGVSLRTLLGNVLSYGAPICDHILVLAGLNPHMKLGAPPLLPRRG